MAINFEMTPQEIAALRQLTKIENDASAVSAAAREFLRLSRLCELKMASGSVEFDSNWLELEALELAETDCLDTTGSEPPRMCHE